MGPNDSYSQKSFQKSEVERTAGEWNEKLLLLCALAVISSPVSPFWFPKSEISLLLFSLAVITSAVSPFWFPNSFPSHSPAVLSASDRSQPQIVRHFWIKGGQTFLISRNLNIWKVKWGFAWLALHFWDEKSHMGPALSHGRCSYSHSGCHS